MSFLWEEYAADPGDKGVTIEIEHKGKKTPFRVKRVLTIDERQAANEAGVEIGLDKNGKPVIKKQDQAAFTKEIVRVGLKWWPFEYGPGKPVPITPQHIAELDGELLTKIANAILGIGEQDQSDLDFFEKKSGEVLSLEEHRNQN